MEKLLIRLKIRWYLMQANKYSRKSNKTVLLFDRNLYFQKYCYYNNKAIRLEKIGKWQLGKN
ncbi:hypothetical protein [Bacillus sp. 03113]|uniref:hypothetical protein n=1 Tax=Bacillus sp. 03113 TaxID=2578211 RepID=UPI00114212A2|nr:hypothetical protein [Bacillus sp. 03113]